MMVIKCAKLYDPESYCLFFNLLKEFFYQMKAQNKGEVPLQISEKLFGVFWKTQITAIMKTFVMGYKPSRSNSAVNQKNKF